MQPELMDLPVWRLQQLLRAREVTPSDLVEASLARIAERDSALNAFLYVDKRGAVATAALQTAAIRRGEMDSLGPCVGIPVAVKDLEDVRGMPTTFGLAVTDTTPARADSVTVARLRASGCIIMGKTNTPADGFIAITKNLIAKPTRNPWALDRSPGGSSGGSAAAVAGGLVPWATASDGGGA